jgi:RimJ/RimL family protein N-acetyltransferase
MTATTQQSRRDELAGLLDLDPESVVDGARLVEDLNLDSLAMMSVLAWLESHGVTIADERARPATVGEVLALLERPAGFPGMTITIGGSDRELPGPAEVPGLPAPSSPLTPILADSAFRLAPVQPGDTDFLYWLSIQPETCFRWRYRGAPPPYDRFAADLWSRVLVQFVVRRGEAGEPVGLVVAYAADSTMRHAYLGAVFVPQHTGTGLAAQAVSTFVAYLFHTFPLHKLYMEVPGFNWSQLASGAGKLFQVEGHLPEHDYYAGQYWDKRICAIYRDAA